MSEALANFPKDAETECPAILPTQMVGDQMYGRVHDPIVADLLSLILERVKLDNLYNEIKTDTVLKLGDAD